MRVPQQALTHQQQADLDTARRLAKMGVPIFLLTRTNAKGELVPPAGWQLTRAIDSEKAIDRWRPGFGLGAVTGQIVDVLDVDPRNGGDQSWSAMKEAGKVPAVYGVSGTASGGMHHWIAPTGLTKRSRDGVDLLAGDRDGKGRSFCFIAPTERRSKTTGQVTAYEWLTEPDLDGIALAQAPGFENAYAAGLETWFGVKKRKTKPDVEWTPYGAKAWAENIGALNAAPDGDGNNTLNRVSHALGALWAGGELGPSNQEREEELKQRIRDIAHKINLDPYHIDPTIESGWNSGVAEPRSSKTYAPDPQTMWPSPREPQEVGRKWLAEQVDDQGRATVRYWRGSWWRYRPELGCWSEVEDLISDLARRLGQVKYPNKDGVAIPWNPTPKLLRDVQGMIEAEVRLDRETEQPAWLTAGELDDPRGLIPFRNGLLRFDDRALRPATPDLFVTSARPFDWSATAPVPTQWLRFLDTLWPGDREAADLLQEWMGYVLSGRIDAQKMMLMVGPPRSGKGTIAQIMTALVGAAHVTSATLDGAGRQFGMQSWIGKSLVLLPDVRSGRGDQSATLERLLSVTGGDQQNVHRKGIADWSGVLGARVMMMSNELPRFWDASAAIADRMVLLQLVRSFAGKEDRGLAGRLMTELPGVLNWALDGLDRLVDSGLRFTVPASSVETSERLREQVSPMSRFLADECVADPSEKTPNDVIYHAWKQWCRAAGLNPGNESTMGSELSARMPELVTRLFTPPGYPRRRARVGIRLRVYDKGASTLLGPVSEEGISDVCKPEPGRAACTNKRFPGTDYCWTHRVYRL